MSCRICGCNDDNRCEVNFARCFRNSNIDICFSCDYAKIKNFEVNGDNVTVLYNENLVNSYQQANLIKLHSKDTQILLHEISHYFFWKYYIPVINLLKKNRDYENRHNDKFWLASERFAIFMEHYGKQIFILAKQIKTELLD